MGQLAPQAPRPLHPGNGDGRELIVQGPPKQIRPMSMPPCAPAKCAYCGLYGALGHCRGCGAPNAPVHARRQIEVTTFGDRVPRYVEVPPFNTVWV
jgi:hypothetical protein